MTNHNHDALGRLAIGAAAGIVGTFVLKGLAAGHARISPGSVPPIRREPGEYMVSRAKRMLPAQAKRHVPMVVQHAAEKSLGIGYGMAAGALYAALRDSRGLGKSTLVRGTALGLAVWAAGYLGWLPATGLMKPIWKQKPEQVFAPAIEHAAYGVATAAAVDLLGQFV